MKLRRILCVLVIAWIASALLAEVKGPSTMTLYRAGEGGYASYRIPALLVTPKGTVLAFCEGRKNSPADSGEIHLMLRRSVDGGKTFSAPQVVWSDGRDTCGNPCPVVDRSTGTILLLMSHNLAVDNEKGITSGASRAGRSVWISRSSDEGETWSRPAEITREVKRPEWTWYATGPGIGIQLDHGTHAGRLVIPCDYSMSGGKVGNGLVIYSDDHGEHWQIGGEPPEKRYNESQVVELSDGRIMLNMRNIRSSKKRDQMPTGRGVAVSGNGGETFGPAHEDKTLVEPICQASLFRYAWAPPEAGIILFSNPAAPAKREKMTVRGSTDNGETWSMGKEIWDGPSAYSSLARLPDGEVGLLFECGETKPYERIDLTRFGLPWLRK